MRNIICTIFAVLSGLTTIAQTSVDKENDSLHHKNLPELTIVGRGSKSDYQQMPEIVGTNIYAGKKNALIVLDNVKGNVVMNTMRQVLAKVPGIHVWESDPSGIQIGIAARGLSPNRSWEFNTRQNGYDIADYFLKNIKYVPKAIVSNQQKIVDKLYLKNKNLKILIDIFDLTDLYGNPISLSPIG